MLVAESEIASALKACERDGNTLSATLRQAWDSGDFRTLVKNVPAKATGAHVSIIGHIVKDELIRLLDSTEISNGFANRFLYVCAKRSKQLPFGGTLQDADFEPLVLALRSVVEWARHPQELQFGSEARQIWMDVYGPLSEGRPGLLGSILGRAEAQVLRLSCLYAALDTSQSIEIPHLRAALAVWEYCEQSAAYIFGDKLGDPDADAILSALRSSPEGLTRTQIRDLFARNLNANRLERALANIAARNLASFEMVSTGGRPAEIWRATTKTTEDAKRVRKLSR